MPELPEVETMRRGIEPLVGARFHTIQFPNFGFRPTPVLPGRRRVAGRLRGRTIQRTWRLGKRVLLDLDDGSSLAFEPRMTGLVLLADPPDRPHLRFEAQLERRGQLYRLMFWDRRGLGSIRLFEPGEVRRVWGPETLGPDALTVDGDQLSDRLGRSPRAIKVALLDQKAVAGIGNLYASEILHVAGIDPRTRCFRLSGRRWRRLVEAISTVLEEAIRYEGSTLADGTYRNALNQSGRYQNQHRVYDRQGQPCPRGDGGAIRRIVQAQRSTFYCPRCQRR